MGQAGIDEVVVEGDALLVGGRLVALGEDAGPLDGGAQRPEAHLGKEGDVLLVVMIEVDRLVVGVVLARQHAVGDATRGVRDVVARGHHVGNGHAFAALVPAALDLVRGQRAAPQEVLAQTHVSPLFRRFRRKAR